MHCRLAQCTHHILSHQSDPDSQSLRHTGSWQVYTDLPVDTDTHQHDTWHWGQRWLKKTKTN